MLLVIIVLTSWVQQGINDHLRPATGHYSVDQLGANNNTFQSKKLTFYLAAGTTRHSRADWRWRLSTGEYSIKIIVQNSGYNICEVDGWF